MAWLLDRKVGNAIPILVRNSHPLHWYGLPKEKTSNTNLLFTAIAVICKLCWWHAIDNSTLLHNLNGTYVHVLLKVLIWMEKIYFFETDLQEFWMDAGLQMMWSYFLFYYFSILITWLHSLLSFVLIIYYVLIYLRFALSMIQDLRINMESYILYNIWTIWLMESLCCTLISLLICWGNWQSNH